MIALISDVHGNWPALRRVLDELDRLGIQEIINLGDTSGYYPFLNECCEALRERSVFSLLGNHDQYLLKGTPLGTSRSATECLAYHRRAVTEENLRWLSELPISAKIHGVNCVHGGWSDPLEEYFRPRSGYFDFSGDPLFASGHTHVPLVLAENKKIYCNPGSVGQPRDGDPRASFAVFDGRNFTIQRIRYDSSEVRRVMSDLGFPDSYSVNLERGTRIGGGIDRYDSVGNLDQ